MRLDKYLAETAQCTRSEAKTLLNRGRVTVNGAVCKKGDTQLREGDSVAVDGAPLAYQQFVYLMLNKPEGVVSASTDKRDTTVVDLVGDAYPRRELFPAGRLDKTSTGFVLLTDDGGFAHEILAPKRHVSKTYTVVIDTPLTEEMRRGFAEGVTLADGTALSPAEVEALTSGRPDRESQAQAGRVSSDQADVRCLRCGRQCPASGRHRRACAGPGPCTGAVAGAFCGGSDSNYHRRLTAFHLIFKKTSHFAGKIFTRTTQNSAFWA